MEKISVIIPTYNCEQYVCESIESVLKQTYPAYEILIIDDGSNDNTKNKILEHIDKDKTKYFYQSNRGPSAARNRGLKEATGKYIAFLDADDLWEKFKLEKTIRFLQNYNFDWVCTSLLKINEKGERKTKRIPDDSFVLTFDTKELKLLKKGIFFFGSVAVQIQTVIAKKECFEKVGLFNESFRICEDTDLFLRFEEAGLKGGYLDEPLTIYRYNGSGLTKGGKIDTLEEGSKVARKHAHLLGLNNKNIRNSYSDYLWQVADIYFTEKRFIKTAKYIIKSLFYNHLNALRIVKKLFFKKTHGLWKK